MKLFKKITDKKEQKKTQKRQEQVEMVQEMMQKVFEKEREATAAIFFGSGLNDRYMFDFKSNYLGGMQQDIQTPNLNVLSDLEDNRMEEAIKITIKPIDVLDELEKIPKIFSLEMIDEKISILKDKSELISQEYTKREIESLISRLENRKKYKEYSDFYKKFDNTDDAKIEKLLEKYDLVMKTSDIFIPEFPDEAIAIMKEYTEKTLNLCEQKPVFYVIAEPEKFRKADEKRDPILLVQSPFGFYWQILGAWDKEMIMLNEL